LKNIPSHVLIYFIMKLIGCEYMQLFGFAIFF
jgi:hypothetical protein